jgi:hypothetical protein
MKIQNIGCRLKFKVLMTFECSVVFATKCVNITVIALKLLQTQSS